MSSWKLFSDADGNYGWEVSGECVEIKPEYGTTETSIQAHSSSRSLPSMVDLLIQGYSELRDNRNEVGNTPMFRTGLGRSVSVKGSSMAKALSILGEKDSTQTAQVQDEVNWSFFSNSTFQTGSGKKVNVSTDGLIKAKALLGLEEDRDEVNGSFFSNSTFQTGSGKKVNVSTDGLIKAEALLGLEEDRDEVNGSVFSNSTFQTGSGKKVNVSTDGLIKAKALLGLEEDRDEVNGSFFSNSTFQTGSGKKVNVSTDGLIKAKALLGLEEDRDQYSHQNLHRENKLYMSNKNCLEKEEGENNRENVNDAIFLKPPLVKTYSEGFKTENEVYPFLKECEIENKAIKPPPIKFHTAGGRSISFSSDALEHARNLLGDPELGNFSDDGDLNETTFAVCKEKRVDCNTPQDGQSFQTSSFCKEMEKNKSASTTFVSPYLSSASLKAKNLLGSNLIKKFDAVENCTSKSNYSKMPVGNRTDTSVDDSFGRVIQTQSRERSSSGPLVDISNTINTNCSEITILSEKKRSWKTNSISPFKRPRSSKFSTPLKRNVLCGANGLSISSSDDTSSKRRVSNRYPRQAPKMYLKEYLGMPLSEQLMELWSDEVKKIKSENAEKFMFQDESGFKSIGIEAFSHMLNDSGASMKYASKLWVTNHYKWIVWKLACYERQYSTKFLTVSNVLEELKYRYEREVNHGHRSAIKRMLEGDAPPSSLIVLCVSAIHSSSDEKLQNSSRARAVKGRESSDVAKVELTDGWYSVAAHLDGLLSKQLAAGKLFVGQKLRIWRAGLCGWVGPISPLEVPDSISLLLHINGTYRAHWADRLGFCKLHSDKGISAPLSFKCIKSNGGPIPWTLVGVTRIYPILYKERSSDGGSIVRSDRHESKIIQLHNHRRSVVVDNISSEFQRTVKSPNLYDDNDSEGAKIFKILETSAEPEFLMAEMSPEQLKSFANYHEKIKAIKQTDMEKRIMKALNDAGLNERDVTPFMRVRVVGLMSKLGQREGSFQEGLITIWNPSSKQQCELIEGQAYAVSGLLPMNSASDILYLQAKGSTTKWKLLSSHAVGTFKPFFSPRKSVLLSNLGEVSLSSEFDTAAVIIYIGEVYNAGQEKKQWVFVTDGSISDPHSEDHSLLAINFSSPYVDDETFAPINCNLTGSTVAFCNLIKRAKDCVNHLWVAEATENSSYFLNFDTTHCSHLKSAAFSAHRWEKNSILAIEKLRKKISLVIGKSTG